LSPIPARAGVYDPAYANVLYNCNSGTGCCLPSLLPNLIHEMFTGTGLYTGQKDLQLYYYTNTLWPKIEEALKQSADDIRNAVAYTLAATGALIDGQVFEQTLVSLQKQTTDSMVSQTVSDQICRFGTLSRSLANSEDRARVTQIGLSTGMIDRQLMKKNMNSGNESGAGRTLGRTADKVGRFKEFSTMFCDATDSDAGLGVCTTSSDKQHNRDIDYTRTLMNPLTLDIDFATAAATADEKNIFALSSNLYAHNLALNLGPSDLQAIRSEGGDSADSRIEKLFDFRSMTAKRSVAQNSFAALAGMKTAGSGTSKTYMQEMLKQLGLSDAKDLTASIGDKPSYYAQMDMLTRKLYQDPAFYANLMESPANVARQQTAIEGITLMQDRDIHESLRRSEMLLSSLLEIYVMREQDGFKDRGTK